MNRLAPIAMLLTGCFYIDPIEQRPSIDISQVPPVTTPYRGDTVMLTAVYSDPQGQLVTFAWRAYACTDAGAPDGPQGCDTVPYAFSDIIDFDPMVPMVRADYPVPVQSLRVVLEATNALGATAKPDQQLIIAVGDHAPDLQLYAVSRYQAVDGTPIDLYAKYGDADDGPANTTLAWQYFTPAQADTYVEADFTVPPDPNDLAHLQVRHQLTPTGVGAWKVVVTATDPLAATTSQMIMIDVGADQPPCIAQYQPIAPLDGTSVLPVTEPTLFQVPIVDDDLDVYPPTSDPILGVTRFAWSILPPGATIRQPLATTGNSVDFDPGAYTPGDIVELRVEIADRVARTLPCADSDLTCSILATSCIQRLTWRVEVQ